jgi:hypothetical protein
MMQNVESRMQGAVSALSGLVELLTDIVRRAQKKSDQEQRQHLYDAADNDPAGEFLRRYGRLHGPKR